MRRNTLMVLALTLLAFGLGVRMLNADVLWFDEAKTVLFTGAKQFGPLTSAQIWDNLAQNAPWQTPGYFISLGLWTQAVGWSDFAARALSLFAGLIALALTVWTARHLMPFDMIRCQAEFERLAGMSGLTARWPLPFFAQTGRLFLQSITARRLAAVAAGLGKLIFEGLNPCGLLGHDLLKLSNALLHPQDQRDQAVLVKLLELGGIKRFVHAWTLPQMIWFSLLLGRPEQLRVGNLQIAHSV